MQDNQKNDFLKNIQLFSSLTNDEIDQLIKKIIVKKFNKNDTILYEDDTNEFMYIMGIVRR